MPDSTAPERCPTNVRISAKRSRKCGQPTVVTVAVGCIHEHMDRRPVCTEHQAALADLRMLCRACRLSPEPHECPLHWRAVTTERADRV
jgi:hypothetical protein